MVYDNVPTSPCQQNQSLVCGREHCPFCQANGVVSQIAFLLCQHGGGYNLKIIYLHFHRLPPLSTLLNPHPGQYYRLVSSSSGTFFLYVLLYLLSHTAFQTEARRCYRDRNSWKWMKPRANYHSVNVLAIMDSPLAEAKPYLMQR